MLLIILLVIAAVIGYQIKLNMFLLSDEFNAIKSKNVAFANECNELNAHIESMKKHALGIKSTNRGSAELKDASQYNFKRKEWSAISPGQHVHSCSASVCKSASEQPFKYLCKYFNITQDEKTLESFENMLNDFEAVEEGKRYLAADRNKYKASIGEQLPFCVRLFSHERIVKEIGFRPVELNELYIPTYTFQYISAGGNSSIKTDIRMTPTWLSQFVEYLADKIKFKKSVKGQRALMTSALRKKIKERDKHECQICGISALKTQNLLLEIDHKLPLSKGGMTTEDNLQTLCWKCNRSKGAKLV